MLGDVSSMMPEIKDANACGRLLSGMFFRVGTSMLSGWSGRPKPDKDATSIGIEIVLDDGRDFGQGYASAKLALLDLPPLPDDEKELWTAEAQATFEQVYALSLDMLRAGGYLVEEKEGATDGS